MKKSTLLLIGLFVLILPLFIHSAQEFYETGNMTVAGTLTVYTDLKPTRSIVSPINLFEPPISGTTNYAPDFSVAGYRFNQPANAMLITNAVNLPEDGWRKTSVWYVKGSGQKMYFASTYTKYGIYTTNGVTIGNSNGLWRVVLTSDGNSSEGLISVELTPPNN